VSWGGKESGQIIEGTPTDRKIGKRPKNAESMIRGGSKKQLLRMPSNSTGKEQLEPGTAQLLTQVNKVISRGKKNHNTRAFRNIGYRAWWVEEGHLGEPG